MIRKEVNVREKNFSIYSGFDHRYFGRDGRLREEGPGPSTRSTAGRDDARSGSGACRCACSGACTGARARQAGQEVGSSMPVPV
jgi:hypothetical protein